MITKKFRPCLLSEELAIFFIETCCEFGASFESYYFELQKNFEGEGEAPCEVLTFLIGENVRVKFEIYIGINPDGYSYGSTYFSADKTDNSNPLSEPIFHDAIPVLPSWEVIQDCFESLKAELTN